MIINMFGLKLVSHPGHVTTPEGLKISGFPAFGVLMIHKF
jgi:hypothetical protein